jgi:prepilin peptidase CpaA
MSSLEINFGVVLFVCVAMTVAAVIDGWKLKVPNWITFPFALSGLAYHLFTSGLGGLTTSLVGLAVGLGLLLVPYIIGGMGAGDVKLFAGVGAWMGATFAFKAFLISTVVGGVLALALVAYRGLRGRDWSIVSKNAERFQMVATELMTIRDPNQLAELAAARKPTAILLPYGIPLAIGTIAYFGYLFQMGLL